jgi:hypothetical protein
MQDEGNYKRIILMRTSNNEDGISTRLLWLKRQTRSGELL